MATIQVYWTGKFNGRLVTIEAEDFNPAIHRLPGDPEASARRPIEAEEAEADIPVIPAPAPRPRKVVIPALEPEKPAKGKKK